MVICMSSIDISQVVRPVRQSVFHLLRHQIYATCLILTLIIYGCLVTAVFCFTEGPQRKYDVIVDSTTHSNLHPARRHLTSRYTDVIERSISAKDSKSDVELTSKTGRRVYLYTIGAFVAVVYLVYLVECWHCQLVVQGNHVDVNTFYSVLDALRQSSPVIWWSAVSYHYIPRHTHITRLRHGRAQSAAHVYSERVVTQRATSAFDYTACGVRDSSSNVTDLELFPVVQITISRHFSFSSELAKRNFIEQRNDFCRAYQTRDDFVDFRQGFNLLPNTNCGSFRSQLLVVRDPDTEPWFLSRRAYWIMSLLTLSWPMRLFVRRNVATLDYKIQKIFGCHYDDSPRERSDNELLALSEQRQDVVTDDLVDYTDDDNVRLIHPLATSQRFDSNDDVSEKLMASRHQCVVVPSYSQALLMDCLSNDSSVSNVKRVQSCVSFTLGRLRTSRVASENSTVVNKSQSFTSRRMLFPVPGDGEELPSGVGTRPASFTNSLACAAAFNKIMTSSTRDGEQSPPPSYDTALAMQIVPSHQLQQHTAVNQWRSTTDSAEFTAPNSPAIFRTASQCTLTIMETCL